MNHSNNLHHSDTLGIRKRIPKVPSKSLTPTSPQPHPRNPNRTCTPHLRSPRSISPAAPSSPSVHISQLARARTSRNTAPHQVSSPPTQQQARPPGGDMCIFTGARGAPGHNRGAATRQKFARERERAHTRGVVVLSPTLYIY